MPNFTVEENAPTRMSSQQASNVNQASLDSVFTGVTLTFLQVYGVVD
jgi:hypothetical protein